MAWIFAVWSGLAAEPPLEDDDLPRRPPLSVAQAMAAAQRAGIQGIGFITERQP